MLKAFTEWKKSKQGPNRSFQGKKLTTDTEVGKEVTKGRYLQVQKASPLSLSRSGAGDHSPSPLSVSPQSATPMLNSRSMEKKKPAWLEMKELSPSSPTTPPIPPTFFSSSFHHQTTLSIYHQKAEQGDPLSQARVGYCYEYKRGTSAIDYKEAFKWYKLSSDQGNSEGQVGLGNLYLEGVGGIAKDEKQGIALIELSVAQGNSRAQGRLGLIYLKGLGGLKPDIKKGLEYYKLAAESGDVEAQYNLGICYETGQGVTKDEKEASHWYKLAAEQGFANAQYNLAVYSDSNRERKDSDTSKDSNNRERKDSKATRSSTSSNTPPAEDATHWYRLAAFQGLKEAQYALGLCYQYGKGRFGKDHEEALRWFQLAAEQGLEKARKQYNLIRGGSKKK